MSTLRAMPVLQVSDVRRSVAFYDTLGFGCDGRWGDDEALYFAIVQRGEVTLGLQLADAPVNGDGCWKAYIYVSDINALHLELRDAGIAVSELRHPDYYGCDDFDVTDPDGHAIAFGQARNPEPGPGLTHNRGRG